jgi:RNA polymerase sigma factor (sigma-70 family)
MNITQEQKEFIENIIKECHGYKGNEYLLDEFYNEVIRRAYSLISKQNELENVKVYVKRIANTSILEIIKTFSGSNKTANINYEIDDNGDIALNYDISFEEVSDKQVCLSENQINQIKEIVCNFDKENNISFYKDIFELRYLKGLNNTEIAKKLEINELEVDKNLLFMLNKLQKEVFSQ